MTQRTFIPVDPDQAALATGFGSTKVVLVNSTDDHRITITLWDNERMSVIRQEVVDETDIAGVAGYTAELADDLDDFDGTLIYELVQEAVHQALCITPQALDALAT